MSKSIVNEKIIKEEIKDYGIDIDDKVPNWIQNFEKKSYSDYSLEIYDGIKYFLVDKQFKIDKDKIVNYYRTVKQVVNMTGIEVCSNILIDFNPQKNSLLLHNILIYRDGHGPINKLLSADLQVLRREYRAEMKILSGDATLSIILDDIKINDTIDVSFSIIDNSELDKDFFSRIVQLEYGPSIHQFHLSIISDKNYSLIYKFLGIEKQIKHSNNSNQNILTYTNTNTPSLTNYKFQPPWYIAGSFIQFSKEKSWKEIAVLNSHYYKNVEFYEINLIELLEKIKLSNYSTVDIILHVIDFINQNIRYLANYRATDFIVPTDPNIVAKRLYGDCKDFVNLFYNILTKLDVDCSPVLVNTTYGKYLQNFLPAINVFNHVILRVKILDNFYFIDPTFRQNVSLIYKLLLPDYTYGLVCNNETTNLIEIKNPYPTVNRISASDEYQIFKDENKISFITTVKFEGWSALKLIDFVENKSENKLWESLAEFYNKYFDIIEKVQANVDVSQKKENVISYTIKYNLDPKQNLKAKQYLLEFYAIDLIDFINFSFPSDVTSDLYYGMPITVNDKIVIYSPTTDFSSSQENVEILDKSFTLSKKVEGYVGRYVCNFRYEKLQDTITKDEYKKFYENNIKATNLLKIQLGIKQKSFFYKLCAKPVSPVVTLPDIIKSKKEFNKLWLILIIPGITLYLMCAAIVIIFKYFN